MRPRMYLLSTQLVPLGKGKSPLVWAKISGKIPPKLRVLPAWGGVGQVIDRCIVAKQHVPHLSAPSWGWVWVSV